MRALVVYCHPNAESFTRAVRDTVLERLQAVGAEIRTADLYAEDFDPSLSATELACYEQHPQNCAPVRTHTDNVKWCNTLIFVYPTWWYSVPAPLKGWLDRVLLPGVAFVMPEGGDIGPGLTHVTRLGVFTTCGASWRLTQFVGAPGKRMLLRGVRLLCHPRCRTGFVAHYSMDRSTDASRTRHLSRVVRTIDRLMRPSRIADRVH